MDYVMELTRIMMIDKMRELKRVLMMELRRALMIDKMMELSRVVTIV